MLSGQLHVRNLTAIDAQCPIVLLSCQGLLSVDQKTRKSLRAVTLSRMVAWPARFQTAMDLTLQGVIGAPILEARVQQAATEGHHDRFRSNFQLQKQLPACRHTLMKFIRMQNVDNSNSRTIGACAREQDQKTNTETTLDEPALTRCWTQETKRFVGLASKSTQLSGVDDFDLRGQRLHLGPAESRRGARSLLCGRLVGWVLQWLQLQLAAGSRSSGVRRTSGLQTQQTFASSAKGAQQGHSIR